MNNRFFLHEGSLPHPSRWAKRLCGSRAPFRADGLLVLTETKQADVRLQIYNADGSSAPICGNGLCCVARHLAERGLLFRDELTVLTDAGIKPLRLFRSDGRLIRVQMRMGTAKVFPSRQLQTANRLWTGNPVDMGNPHFVLPLPDIGGADLARLGPAVSARFPEGCNVETVEKREDGRFLLRVWERGVGLTAACGSGICAAAAVFAAQEGAASVIARVREGGRE